MNDSRVNVLFYGLGLRLSAIEQVRHFDVMSDIYYYFMDEDVEDGHVCIPEKVRFGRAMTRICHDRLKRCWRIVEGLKRSLRWVGAAQIELEQLSAVGDSIKQAAAIELSPENDTDCRYRYQRNEFCREVFKNMLDAAHVALRLVSRHRDNEVWSQWFELGLTITDSYHYRDEVEDEEPEPREDDELEPLEDDELESWEGVEPVDMAFLLMHPCDMGERQRSRFADLIASLQLDTDRVLPALNADDPYQQDLLADGFVPRDFRGWFLPEIGFRRLLDTYPEQRRPTFERDHLFLKWAGELKDSPAINVDIMNRWNDLPEAERNRVCPACPELITGVQTVKKAKKLAADERDHGEFPERGML